MFVSPRYDSGLKTGGKNGKLPYILQIVSTQIYKNKTFKLNIKVILKVKVVWRTDYFYIVFAKRIRVQKRKLMLLAYELRAVIGTPRAITVPNGSGVVICMYARIFLNVQLSFSIFLSIDRFLCFSLFG